MAEEKRYVDADALINSLRNIPNPGYNTPYSSGALDSQVNTLISQAMSMAFSVFITQLENAISTTARPYTQCMLCTRKPHDPDPFAPDGR
jgi:hypothetical protein